MNDVHTPSTTEREGLTASASISFILSLPDELMSLVFGLTVSRPVFAPTPPLKEWWSIPWVNRHFRRIALQTPRFWATPVFVNEELLDSMLSRSGATPLTVCFDDRSRYLDEEHIESDSLGLTLLTKALLHLQRIENLTIFGNRLTIEHSRQLLERQGAAPLLCRCSITCYESWETLPPALQEEQPRVIAFSESLFDGQAPQLRALHLHESQISWTSPLLSHSIVVLVLTSPPHPGDTEMILDALARMPELRYLVLLPGTPSHYNPLTRLPRMAEMITLSQLRQCILVVDLENAPAFLETLVAPQSAEMRMICHAPGGMEDVALVVPMAQGLHRWYEQQQPAVPPSQLLSVRVQAYTTSHWDNLRISTGWEPQPNLLSDSDHAGEPETPSFAAMSADVVVAHLHGTELVLSSSLVLLRTLPISNVREIMVDYGVHSVTSIWWRGISERMPSLGTVVLQGHNASDSFFEALALSLAPSSGDEQDSQVASLLPNVRNVSINGVDLAYPPRCTQVARALRRMERAQRRISELCLRACNIPRARVLELQVHVETMIVDERGRPVDPEGPLAWSFRVQDF